MIIYQPVESLNAVAPSLAALYGICTNDPIIFDNKGISEALDDELTGAFE